MGAAMSDIDDPYDIDEPGHSPRSSSSGRSNGNGRYDLRPRSTSPPDSPSEGTSAAAAVNRPTATVGPRPASSILQNETLRQVLSLLAQGSDLVEDDDDDDDEGDIWMDYGGDDRGGVEGGDAALNRRPGRGVRGLLLYSPDHGDNSFDEDETAASVGVQDVLSSLRGSGRGRGGKRPPAALVRPSPEMLKTLNASDFSFLTRQWLGMEQIRINQEDSAETSDKSSAQPRASASTESSTSTTSSSSSSKSAEPPPPTRMRRSMIPKAVTAREMGMMPRGRGHLLHPSSHDKRRGFRGTGFTLGTQCQLLGKYLPNHCKRMETYDQQVFNGTYSNCGDIFVSSCQGRHA